MCQVTHHNNLCYTSILYNAVLYSVHTFSCSFTTMGTADRAALSNLNRPQCTAYWRACDTNYFFPWASWTTPFTNSHLWLKIQFKLFRSILGNVGYLQQSKKQNKTSNQFMFFYTIDYRLLFDLWSIKHSFSVGNIMLKLCLVFTCSEKYWKPSGNTRMYLVLSGFPELKWFIYLFLLKKPPKHWCLLN